MNIHSKTFASVPAEIRDEWLTLWTDSAEQLDEGMVVREVVDDDSDASQCVVILEGRGLGELRVSLSQPDLEQSRHEVYLTALGIAVTQARFATGF